MLKMPYFYAAEPDELLYTIEKSIKNTAAGPTHLEDPVHKAYIFFSSYHDFLRFAVFYLHN